jgi:hypothetical protein
MTTEQPAKKEVLTWALKKIARDDYFFTTSGLEGKWELQLWELEEPGLSESEFDDYCKLMEQHLDVISQFPERIRLEDGTELTREQYVDSVFHIAGPVGRYLLLSRKRLSNSTRTETEGLINQIAPAKVADEIALAVLRDFARRFAKTVGRAESLRVLGVDVDMGHIPELVQRYLAEATECFISGRYLACLMVCRSTIEFSIRELLKSERRDLHPQAGDIDESSLKELIAIGRRELPWRFRQPLDWADEVRDKARLAVHRSSVPVEECKEMFLKTRSILAGFYSR